MKKEIHLYVYDFKKRYILSYKLCEDMGGEYNKFSA